MANTITGNVAGWGGKYVAEISGAVTLTKADGVAVKGDWIEVLCDGTNFYVKGATNADGGITLA